MDTVKPCAYKNGCFKKHLDGDLKLDGEYRTDEG
jgi:hypothetical protein